jgi:predicted PurR-regulated permease PerM
MDSKKIWRLVIFIAAIIIGCCLVYLVRNALVPVFIALILAYLLDPVIAWLERKKVNRTFAILSLAFLIVVGAGVVGTVLVTQAQREIIKLYYDLPGYLARTETALEPLAQKYLGVALPGSIDELMVQAKARLAAINPETLKPVSRILARVTTKTLAIAGWFIGLLIIPVFLFYFLRDWGKLKENAAGYIPLAYRDYLLEKFSRVDEVLGAFIRGQLTVCAILALLYSIGLSIVGVDLAVVIGVVSGLAFIVPYFGTAIGIVAASTMSLLRNGISWNLPLVWLTFAVIQFLESYFITPRIVGKKVGLSPVAVIVSLLIGADLLGFLGILIAVPAAAVINVFVKDGLERYRQSAFFLDKGEKKN